MARTLVFEQQLAKGLPEMEKSVEHGEEQEEFLDLCNQVKKMTEDQQKRKRKHEHAEPDQVKPAKPTLVYGPVDWRVKETEKPNETKTPVEDKATEDAEPYEMVVEGSKKKSGKIKRRGKKKGKRNKPDREEEEKTKDSAMDC